MHAMRQGLLGAIASPHSGAHISRMPAWCADNGCYSKGWPGEEKFLEWLKLLQGGAKNCHFVVAPDVMADAAATLERSKPWLSTIRELGFPVAMVAQNGQENVTLPWRDFNVLFIGGDTEFKLGAVARELAAEAKSRCKRVHMGRVNSIQRVRYANDIGCDSVDGTTLAYAPDRRLPRMMEALRQVDPQYQDWESRL